MAFAFENREWVTVELANTLEMNFVKVDLFREFVLR